LDFSKETQNKVGVSVRAQSCQLSEEMSETLGDQDILIRSHTGILNHILLIRSSCQLYLACTNRGFCKKEELIYFPSSWRVGYKDWSSITSRYPFCLYLIPRQKIEVQFLYPQESLTFLHSADNFELELKHPRVPLFCRTHDLYTLNTTDKSF
jgi:hypothetical protein